MQCLKSVTGNTWPTSRIRKIVPKDGHVEKSSTVPSSSLQSLLCLFFSSIILPSGLTNISASLSLFPNALCVIPSLRPKILAAVSAWSWQMLKIVLVVSFS